MQGGGQKKQSAAALIPLKAVLAVKVPLRAMRRAMEADNSSAQLRIIACSWRQSRRHCMQRGGAKEADNRQR